jgi:DNA-binding CsgD family transcriptional regulator
LDHATHHDWQREFTSKRNHGAAGFGDELRAALLVGADCWGYLCLHRANHPLGFTAGEVALVARLGPHIAHALRQGLLLNGSPAGDAPSAPGVVLLADDLSTVAINDEAQDLLAQIDPNRSAGNRLPVAVYAVAAALKATDDGTTADLAPPSTRVRTLTGRWLRIHASRLHGSPGDASITVVVEPIEAHRTAPLLLAAHGLTPREAQVATLVLRGEPTSTIADTLHISRHTVQDHLKVVFDKMGVHSRRDLVGHLLRATDPTSSR